MAKQKQKKAINYMKVTFGKEPKPSGFGERLESKLQAARVLKLR
jgi:hypothetical protein